MTEFTAHFRLPIPDFNQEPWHDQFRDLCVAIDDMAHQALLANANPWENDHAYSTGDIVLDETNGLLYVCAIAHTSPPFPTTFLTFRNANPSHWNSIVQIPQFRGIWMTATTYVPNDFVVDNNRYAVCLEAHVSTVFNADLGAGRWAVLIDLTTVDVGINGLTEASISASSTVNLGAAPTSQILISGTGQAITSFGTAQEEFKIVRFDGANTITASANIILRGEAVRNTVAGDVMFLRSDSVGNWRELFYWTDATEADHGVIRLASNAQALAGVDDLTAMTPLKAKSARTAEFDTYFPAGTTILMQQTTPPVGWTKSVAHNDKALRVVSGAAGSGGLGGSFSTVFGQTGTQNFTLTAAHIPAHQHGVFLGQDSHNHTLTNASNVLRQVPSTGSLNAGANFLVSTPTVDNTTINIAARSTAGAFAGSDNLTGSIGGGGAHAHAMDIRVQFVDVIIAVRNA